LAGNVQILDASFLAVCQKPFKIDPFLEWNARLVKFIKDIVQIPS
jgi:hypothetical protein